jgi:RimJ/RimL family protein N-acetyltransferase
VLTFATAAESSLDEFMSVSAGSAYAAELRKYAESLLEQGRTRLDWCVLALDDGVPVARAAFWAGPGDSGPTDLVLIAADWSDEELAAGHELLARMHELGAAQGAEHLSHSIDSPPNTPQFQEEEGARARLLEEAGYELLRDGLRWRFQASSWSGPAWEHSLVFRPLPEVGEKAFVETIAATFEGTPDTWLNENIAEHGLLGAAQEDFEQMKAMDHQPEWFELAYTEGGDLAGVIIAAGSAPAVIAYVGVVPEQRGRGLAQQLVRRGTERLLDTGVDEIRGDCDRENIPMVKAFQRAGYEQFARRRTYRRAVSDRRRIGA